MKVTIPSILAGQGGSGQALMGMGKEVSRLGQAAGSTVKAMQDQYAYNNLAFYEDEDQGGLKIKERSYHDQFWRQEKGTDPDAIGKYEAGLKRLQESYAEKARAESAGGDMIYEALTKRATIRRYKYLEESDKINGQLVFNRTLDANMLRAKTAANDLSQAFASPAVIDVAWQASDQEAESQRSVLGNYTDELKRKRREVFTENGLRIGLANPSSAPAVLNALDSNPEYRAKIMANMSPDRVDETEWYIKRSREMLAAEQRDQEAQLLSARRAAKETMEVAQESTRQTFVGFYADGKLRESTILQSNLDAKEKKMWIDEVRQQRKAIASVGENTVKTDKVLEASLYTSLVQDAENVSETEILRHAGSKLTKDDAKQLIDERRKILNGETDPGRHASSQAIMEALKRDRNAGIFGEAQEGDLEYSKQVGAFRRWVKANPDKEPQEYYEKIMEPVKGERLFGILDGVNPGKQRQAMEKAGNIPKGKAKDAMPPAQGNKGRSLTDTTTGKRYKSDGENWIEVK